MRFSPQVTRPRCLYPRLLYLIPCLCLCHIALDCVSSVPSVPACSHFYLWWYFKLTLWPAFLSLLFFSLQRFSALHTIHIVSSSILSFSSQKLPYFLFSICSVSPGFIVPQRLSDNDDKIRILVEGFLMREWKQQLTFIFPKLTFSLIFLSPKFLQIVCLTS